MQKDPEGVRQCLSTQPQGRAPAKTPARNASTVLYPEQIPTLAGCHSSWRQKGMTHAN